ncbi:hypothetical protein CLAIMM_12994 [Cladophialophora immunda]|nr:hypothetical protein CLAIMM_12994 [Cladophialophora immunda]
MKDFVRDTTGVEVVTELADQIKGKTFVITGASDKGLGAETAIALARGNPAHLVLTARAQVRVDPVIARIKDINASIKATFVPIELDDFDSVRSAADDINKSVDRIDCLINNAGIMAVDEYKTNKSGVELQFATNHLGHFLLTKILMPKILAAGPGARIVNLTSLCYKISPVRFDDYNFADGKEYDPWSGYGQAKTSNILFARALAEKLRPREIQSYAVHPGAILTTNLGRYITEVEKSLASIDPIAVKNTGRHFNMMAEDIPKPIEQGISTTLIAALDPRLKGNSGACLADTKVEPTYEYAEDSSNAENLWKLSEQLVGEKFEI